MRRWLGAGVLLIGACASDTTGMSSAGDSTSMAMSTSESSTTDEMSGDGDGGEESSGDGDGEGSGDGDGEPAGDGDGDAPPVEVEVLVETLGYDEGPSQVLDLYTADPAPEDPVAVAVLAHGGLWQGGDKSSLDALCRGIVEGSGGAVACASINYRLSDSLGGDCGSEPGVDTYREQLRDFGAALGLLQSQADTWGLDAGAMWVGGHSAGGHLALSLDLRYAEFALACDDCERPRGTVGFEGIYDIGAWDAYDADFWGGQFSCATRKAFGAPPSAGQPCVDPDYGMPCWQIGSPRVLAEQHQSLSITSPGPALLIHSPDDDWVDVAEAVEMAATLEAAFPELSVLSSTDGGCGTGSHNGVLGDAALAACIVEFVRSDGAAI